MSAADVMRGEDGSIGDAAPPHPFLGRGDLDHIAIDARYPP
jgi:hypothetical protein